MSPAEVIKLWVDLFNKSDAESIANLYHQDAINHQVTTDPIIGRENIRHMFLNEFATADMTCMVENIFEDGEWGILEWKDPLGLRGCGFFHIVDGKIKFQRGYWDKLSFLRMHGLPISTD
ncbi:MAG: ester cyclase [Bacteroidetes bacterium]|nr:ester cyclase [Bacteroidota bacterium]